MNAFLNLTIDIIDRFRGTTNDDELWSLSNQIAQEFGGTALLAGEFKQDDPTPLWIMSTMDENWMTDYMAEGLYQLDPFVNHLNTSFEPILWQTGTRVVGDEGRKEMDAFYDGLGQYYRSTVGSPFRSGIAGNRKILTFASDRNFKELGLDAEENPEGLNQLNVVLSLVATNIGLPIDADSDIYNPDIIRLSPREIEVLSWLAQGHMNSRIAEKMSIAEITVRKHIRSAREKLGAATREQALSIAIINGLVAP